MFHDPNGGVIQHWQLQTALHVFHITPFVRIGFELCFMDWQCLAEGEYPAERLLLTFSALCASIGESREPSPSQMPVSYCWSGASPIVSDVEYLEDRYDWNNLLATYRYVFMQDAFERFQRQQSS